MKILLTGSAGFIGSHLYQKLTETGHEVIGIDNFFHASKSPIIEKVLDYDIRNISTLEQFVRNVDVVIHLAAQIHVDYSIQYPVETFDINVNGLFNILELCRKFKRKLVFASSSEVYGTAKGSLIKIDENHLTKPLSPYAVSKLTGDLLCQNYKAIYGMDINIVRNFNTFGPWQDDTSYGGAIAIFTRQALTNEPITIFGDGNQERDYMYVDDALQGYLLALEKSFDQPVNFGAGEVIKINQLAEMIKRITKSKSPIIHVNPRPNEVQRLCADITLAKSLGFKPKTDFEQDLIKYINWYQNNNEISQRPITRVAAHDTQLIN